MLYRIELWTKNPDPTERGFSLARAEVCGSLKTARLTATSWLPEQAETTYSARWARHPWVEIRELIVNPKGWARGFRLSTLRPLVTIQTPIYYVPSVGDLGYTP